MLLLIADVHPDGTIRAGEGWANVIHKESTQLQERYACVDSFDVAHERAQGPASVVLKLTSLGAVESVWVRDAQREHVTELLGKWKGCYGLWPIRRLND